MTDLFEMWNNWFSRTLSPSAELWGIRIIWWGRIGKLLQFAGALTVLADIIGPTRLRAFGGTLHSTFRLEDMKNRFKAVRNYRAAMRRYMSSASGSEEETQALDEAQRSGFDTLNWAMTGIAFVASLFFIWTSLTFWSSLALTIVAFAIGVVFIFTFGPIFTQTVIYIAMFFGLCLDVLILEPIAWLLERPALDRWIKLVALMLLLIGFHFDLLTDA